MIYLRRSKIGLILSSIFLFLATLALIGHLYSMQVDPQDTGTSAVFLIFFTFPWSIFIPHQLVSSDYWKWLVYPMMISLVLVNAFLLYLVAGGLGIRRR
jgi:membrane protein YdbS with pleckstrin-like domain